jgi:uncharacterized protein HemY
VPGRLRKRMAKLLIVVGLVIAGIGLLMMLGLPFGRLPGDLSYRRGNFSFHFPLATSIIVSIILTLLLNFFLRR